MFRRVCVGSLTSMVFLILAVLPAVAAAADTCPIAGTRPATAEDAAVKNNQVKVGTCYNPNDGAVGQGAEAAKQYLKSLNAGGRYPKCSNPPSVDQQFNMLNAQFATCAAKFLKDFQDKNGSVRINRSANTAQCEGQMCYNNGGCGALKTSSPNATVESNHTRGFSMDVAASAGQDKIAAFAKQNPNYGVCFPFVGSSFNDPVHMILAGAPGSEGNGPGCAGVSKKGCDGAAFDPKSVPPPTAASPSGPQAAPSTPLSNAIRDALGMQPQSQPDSPSPPPPPPPPPQALPSQPALSSTAQAPLSSGQTPTSGLIQIATNSPIIGRTPSIDLIDEYVNPTSDSIEIAKSVPIDLNDDTLASTTELHDTSIAKTAVPSASGTIALNQNYPQQETFTSGDLANNPVWGVVPEQNGALAQLFVSLKGALLSAMGYLKPFGSTSQRPLYSNEPNPLQY